MPAESVSNLQSLELKSGTKICTANFIQNIQARIRFVHQDAVQLSVEVI